MRIDRLDLKDFTVFGEVTFEFSPGVNVLIGPNGTGKTHALKFIHGISTQKPGDVKAIINENGAPVFYQYFLPENPTNLLRKRAIVTKSSIFWNTDESWFALSADGRTGLLITGLPPNERQTTFIPAREIISSFPGFMSSWLKRESPFDKTYFDLCLALDERPLRELTPEQQKLLEPLERAIGGKVINDGGRFYIESADGKMEMPLVAEGHRKLATIARLIRNGTITPGTALLWDEPEANMNPAMVVLLRDLLLGFAASGVQVFIATHDYLLTRELSMYSEYKGAPVKFFGLYRPEPGAPVQVESASVVNGLEHNPLIDEFAAHYERETALFVESAEKS